METKGKRLKSHVTRYLVASVAIPLGLSAQPAGAITPPDMTMCESTTCQDPPKSHCSDAGFAISLKSYMPAYASSEGMAKYVYEICSPPAGTCSSTVRPGEPCLDNNLCKTKGQASDPTASCSRECSVSSFRGLSHFDVTFPDLTASACVTTNTSVTGSCSAVDKNNDGLILWGQRPLLASHLTESAEIV